LTGDAYTDVAYPGPETAEAGGATGEGQGGAGSGKRKRQKKSTHFSDSDEDKTSEEEEEEEQEKASEEEKEQESEEEEEEVEEEGKYFVESVTGERTTKGVVEYRVKWYDYESTTWEPSTSFVGHTDAIKVYLAANKATINAASSKSTSSRSLLSARGAPKQVQSSVLAVEPDAAASGSVRPGTKRDWAVRAAARSALAELAE